MRWRFWRRDGREAAQQAVADAEAQYQAAKRRTRHVQKMAPAVANLPAEEFADRAVRAFRGWA